MKRNATFYANRMKRNATFYANGMKRKKFTHASVKKEARGAREKRAEMNLQARILQICTFHISREKTRSAGNIFSF